MTWQKTLAQGKEIVLCTTCDDGTPHANIVISQGVVEGKLLVNACQMDTTLRNIEQRKQVCIIARDDDEYYRIKGKARTFGSGKIFDLGVRRNEGPAVKKAVLITIAEVFDLDKVTQVK